jgi:hypothetical protein
VTRLGAVAVTGLVRTAALGCTDDGGPSEEADVRPEAERTYRGVGD